MALAVSAPGHARARVHHYRHHRSHHAWSLVDSTASYSDIVIDADTGRILHASHPDSLRHPASLSKMMTLYILFQALEDGRLTMNSYLPVSANAAEQPPSKLGLRRGSRIRVHDAILGIVTESANDDAVVIAEALGGSEHKFGEMMTRQARALGMMHSHFNNPSGLPDPGQISTAHDMAILGDALIHHFPQYYHFFDTDSFTYAGVYHHNHNHLKDRYEGMDGIKTGYIRASGFNLVASVQRNGKRLIGVIFGGHSVTSRDNRMAQLLDNAFEKVQDEPEQVASIGEGDSADVDDSSEYVKLPAKNEVIFPPRSSGNFEEAMNTVNPELVRPEEKPAPKPASAPAESAPPPAAMPAPSGKINVSGNWGIQIGAFSDPESGHEALANAMTGLPQMLGNADPIVQKVSAGTVTLFRARLMSLDQDTAQSACNYLIQHGQNCLTVSP